MRKFKKEIFVEKVLDSDGLILDIGGGTPWVTGWIHKKYRPIFEKKVKCVDVAPDTHPHIVADVMNLPFVDNSVGGIICNAVLEHIPDPLEAIDEMYRVLEPRGRLAFYVPWIFHYHASPHDYYRYSIEGVRYLVRHFSYVDIYQSEFGKYEANKLYTIIGLAFPQKTDFAIKWFGTPLWKVMKGVIYTKYLLGGASINKIHKMIETKYIDNWGHGYWCYCLK